MSKDTVFHLLIHTVFSTKNQLPLIDTEIEPKLYDAITRILLEDAVYCPAQAIGGGADHIHVIFALSRNWSIEDVINLIKKRGAEWMRLQGDKYIEFDWQESYAAVSIGSTDLDHERSFLANQRNYHGRVAYKDEFRRFLTENGIEFEEEGLWD